jgi:hypothetical protein
VSNYDDDVTARDSDSTRGSRLGPTAYVLIGLGIGFLLGLGLAWAVGGNPFSALNEVEYIDVVVGTVTEDADQICWSDDPERRDAGQTCAILALDPALDVPEVGDAVTLGVVDIRTPDGAEFTQVVHAAPSDDPALDPAEPVEETGADDTGADDTGAGDTGADDDADADDVEG